MRVLQSWAFVHCAALIVGLASIFLWPLPPKMAAEPGPQNYLSNVLLTGFAWLLLALMRFLVAPRSRDN
jgi:hypothetical protein